MCKTNFSPPQGEPPGEPSAMAGSAEPRPGRCKVALELGSPALSMIPGRQQSWRPWFPWGFSLAPSRKRAAFIRSAGEP